MRIGTKSLLFGAHQFIIHPIILFGAWWEMFGFPWDPRLWVAFVVHDLGYFGKQNMDGPEGERHVLFGARVMGFLFDRPKYIWTTRVYVQEHGVTTIPIRISNKKWEKFSLFHSRYWASSQEEGISRLCVADKMAIAMSPKWWYLWSTRLTGEIDEYRSVEKHVWELGDSSHESDSQWYDRIKVHMAKWAQDHYAESIANDRKRGMKCDESGG